MRCGHRDPDPVAVAAAAIAAAGFAIKPADRALHLLGRKPGWQKSRTTRCTHGN
jgi:hypothetical protein